MLDADEYLHLAVHAGQSGDHHAALDHLHRALEQNPEHVAAMHILAAEHAQLGLYERACTGMRDVLALAPDMVVARFQLGLLNLQLERPEEARQAFSVLAKGATEEDLRAFANAYLHLLDDQLPQAATLLQQGLDHCNNPALKADMLRVLSSLAPESVGAASSPTDPGSDSEKPVYLGAYRDPHETD